jgi:hypothetical protein
MRASAGTHAAPGHRPRQAAGGLLTATAIVMMAFAVLALGYVIYVLWPRWPDAPVAIDAPSIPIVIGDATFRVPPGAIRQKMQRRPGTQDRVNLMYLWPALTPAATLPKAITETSAVPVERLFVDIATNNTTMAPEERLKTIYPRYADANKLAGPDGLTLQSFRDDTPYRGEDLLYDASAPDRFLVRCTRDTKLVRGTCIYERFFGTADMTVRFERAWLSDWRAVLSGIERLTEQLQPSG